MWNLNSLGPEPSIRLFAIAVALGMLGAGACGPSSGGVPATYTVTFALSDSPEDLSTVSFSVDYQGGDFLGSGAGVSCELVASDDNETADFDDDDAGGLDVDIDASDNPLQAGSEIVTCDFEANTQPTAANFTITVTDAEDDGGDPVNEDDVDIVVTSTDLASSQALTAGSVE